MAGAIRQQQPIYHRRPRDAQPGTEVETAPGPGDAVVVAVVQRDVAIGTASRLVQIGACGLVPEYPSSLYIVALANYCFLTRVSDFDDN